MTFYERSLSSLEAWREFQRRCRRDPARRVVAHRTHLIIPAGPLQYRVAHYYTDEGCWLLFDEIFPDVGAARRWLDALSTLTSDLVFGCIAEDFVPPFTAAQKAKMQTRHAEELRAAVSTVNGDAAT